MPDINALVDGNLLIHRHHAQRHHPVHVAVNRRNLIRFKQLLDQELLPDFLCGITLKVFLVAAVPNIHFLFLHTIPVE